MNKIVFFSTIIGLALIGLELAKTGGRVPRGHGYDDQSQAVIQQRLVDIASSCTPTAPK